MRIFFKFKMIVNVITHLFPGFRETNDHKGRWSTFVLPGKTRKGFGLSLVSIIVFFAICGCQKKKEEALPDTTTPRETQSGRNTVYMTVNGKPMVPKVVGGESAYPQIMVGMSYLNGLPGLRLRFTYEIGATPLSIYFYSYFLNPDGIGKYSVGPGQTFWVTIMDKSKPCIFPNALYEGTYSGELEIKKFDPSNEVYSGTFHAKVWLPENPCDTIRIENGIFDVKGI
jgi:hypothetical protein